RTLIRKIRLFLAGCGVYFYSRRDVEKLLRENHIPEYEIFDLSRDFILIAKMDQNNQKVDLQTKENK
ncbi:MAG: hypothetical protein MUO78_02300, partial [candidate division Zixibacteria bacterium]|nr:hypothetical protein [candidate division Zixibacteria bacterium]